MSRIYGGAHENRSLLYVLDCSYLYYIPCRGALGLGQRMVVGLGCLPGFRGQLSSSLSVILASILLYLSSVVAVVSIVSSHALSLDPL